MSKDKEGSFISHLTELRKRLINSLIFLALLFVICYYFSEYIYGFLVEPYANAVKDDDTNRRLIFTALQETFLTYLKVSFFAAFFITSPFILIQIWKFIAPGLYNHEKKAIMPYLVVTPILFLLTGDFFFTKKLFDLGASNRLCSRKTTFQKGGNQNFENPK